MNARTENYARKLILHVALLEANVIHSNTLVWVLDRSVVLLEVNLSVFASIVELQTRGERRQRYQPEQIRHPHQL